MELIIALGVGLLCGALFTAYRLRGEGTTMEAVRRALSGGPRPTVPK